MSSRYWLMPPVTLSMAMLLSLRMTSISGLAEAMLLSASKAMPPVSAPSPMTATMLRSVSPLRWEAMAMPSAADMDVEECPTPNASYSLSKMLGNPHSPPCLRLVWNLSRRPVSILCP